MTKTAHDTTPPPPPVMLVVLPPDLAQIIVDRLIEDDRTMAADMAAIRAKYEPGCLPPFGVTPAQPARPRRAPSRRSRVTPTDAEAA